jgi:hypothetical protein
MKIGKIYANKGIPRNKKPLKNIVISVKFLAKLDNEALTLDCQKYKFKDLGYLGVSEAYENSRIKSCYHFWTPEKLKSKLTVKQWAKFCNGCREFVIQRRIDGHNIKKEIE